MAVSESVLADLITSKINCPSEIELQGSSCLLIDGLALVLQLEDHLVLKRLGTLQIAFKQQFFKLDLAITEQIHVIFDRYQEDSSQEREKDAQSPLALSDVLLKMTVSSPSQFFKLPCIAR